MAQLGLALPKSCPSLSWLDLGKWGHPLRCQQAIGQAKQSSAWLEHAPSMLASTGFIFGCKPLHLQGAHLGLAG